MNIVFLGSGNTATIMARLMYQQGHRILQVWSRSVAHAGILAMEVEAEVIESFSQINPAADICIMAVSDAAVPVIASQLSLRKKILVHTAGSVSIDALKHSSLNYGVLYPLQSLRKELSFIPEIPFLVDGNSDDVKIVLTDFAKSISSHVTLATDEQRLKMHVAAVVANNFTNHLYAMAEAFCSKHQLPFELLHPLIIETASRLKQGNALDLQTGPARRADMEIVKDEPELKNLYLTISESILKMYHKKSELR